MTLRVVSVWTRPCRVERPLRVVSPRAVGRVGVERGLWGWLVAIIAIS